MTHALGDAVREPRRFRSVGRDGPDVVLVVHQHRRIVFRPAGDAERGFGWSGDRLLVDEGQWRPQPERFEIAFVFS
jgi:hypothetical protein